METVKANRGYPTPHPEVNEIIEQVLKNAEAILQSNFLGMYLHGSLATGGFDSKSSDIDFVVVTKDRISDVSIEALKESYAQFFSIGNKWARALEGTYIPQKEFRRYQPSDGPYVCVHEENFYLAHHESHWVIQRHVLRKQGVVMAGPDPITLIDFVSPEDLKRAVKSFLREWWAPTLQESERLEKRDYQVYAVLTMCRALFSLETGEVASKPVSARWVQIAHPKWKDLIEWALDHERAALPDKISETKAFITYTLNQSQVNF